VTAATVQNERKRQEWKKERKKKNEMKKLKKKEWKKEIKEARKEETKTSLDLFAFIAKKFHCNTF